MLEERYNGIGIPNEEIAHLFESFHRARDVGTIQGTGLGLAVVKNALDMYGGTIEVNSRVGPVGSGTCFTVRLPHAFGVPSFGPTPLLERGRS